MKLMTIGDLKHNGLNRIPFHLGLLDDDELKSQSPSWVRRTRDWMNDLDQGLPVCEFRGVNADALNRVRENGIDVVPTQSPIFTCGQFDKAWEYGGMPKLILALRPKSLTTTWRYSSAESTLAELQEIEKTFPTGIVLQDGTSYHSRFPQDHTAFDTQYEREYARWIPGDPFEALHSLFLFASEADFEPLLKLME